MASLTMNLYGDSQEENFVRQYDFDDETQVMLKLTAKSASDRRLAKLVEWLFVVMGVYQFVVDVLFFVHYAQLDRSWWQKYECYCYVVTNTSNMKQIFVFGLCWMMSGTYDQYMKQNASVWKALIWILYVAMALPVLATHIVPFMAAYCWIVAAVACVGCLAVFCCVREWMKDEDDHSGFELNAFAILVAVLSALGLYLVFALWPVAAMSRLYNGEGYVHSILSVYNDRRTIDYVEHFEEDYHRGTQLYSTTLWCSGNVPRMIAMSIFCYLAFCTESCTA